MKFWALVISKDLTLKRMWIDESIAFVMLKTFSGIKIYNAAHQQEAVLTKDSVVWKSVQEVDKLG